MVKIHKYEESEEDILRISRPSIFLAGPTVRGHQPHLISWRFAAVEEFEKQGFDGELIIPEFTSHGSLMSGDVSDFVLTVLGGLGIRRG
jgi:hypothetical protein